MSKATAVLGSQWGDEGKGKLIDILSKEYDLIVRATGGANAGHTIYVPDPENPDKPRKHVFHLIPSGILYENVMCVICNGVVLHLETMFMELERLKEAGVDAESRLVISDRAHLLFDYHKLIDGLQEDMKGDKKVGTTKRGIGPCYTDKIRRNGIRVCDLADWAKFEDKYRANLEMFKKMYGEFEYDADGELEKVRGMYEKIKPMIKDTAYYISESMKAGKKVLAEGANGALLDVDHGTYPFVTSSNPTFGGLLTGTGMGARTFEEVIGVMKAYTTRVGAGPFPSELHDELGDQIREAGGEFGSTTGRPRRCGWFDGFVGRYSVMVNGFTSINLTKLDVLTGVLKLQIVTGYKGMESFPADLSRLDGVELETVEMDGWTEDISGVRDYSALPEAARNYIEKIEEVIGCRISSVGVGIKRDDMIFR